jgi:hypothetical protein
MKEINLGPVANPDGSPTEFTKQMLADTGRDPEEFAANVAANSNTYISPFVSPILKGLVTNWLNIEFNGLTNRQIGQNFNTDDPESNDSFSWACYEMLKFEESLNG